MIETKTALRYCFLIFLAATFTLCSGNVSFSEDDNVTSLIKEHTTSSGNSKSLQSGSEKAPLNKSGGGKSILIRLGRTHFDPLRAIPVRESAISKVEAHTKAQKAYYIVQFDGPVLSSWKKTLENVGVELLDYVPDFAFIARMDSTKEDAVRALPHVRWVGIYQPSYRISQNAVDKIFVKTDKPSAPTKVDTGTVTLRVIVFPGENLERIRTAILNAGGHIVDEVSTEWKTTLKVEIHRDKIADLPPINGIKWIETWPQWRLHNNKSIDIMNVRPSQDSHGLYGEGITVGVCDSGLDQGSTQPASLLDDFQDGSGGSRVTQIFDRVGDGASDVISGHGTHVAGSVLGNGAESGSDPSSDTFPATCFAGTAPKASLVFQAVGNNTTGALSGLPSDLNILFNQADGAGADLHTNSWGSDYGGMYTSDSRDVDEYMWNHKDFLILFSAGNNGIDKDGDGVIDLYSLGSPGTAKNCLTVGASEGNRPSGCGYDYTWGEAWPYNYSMDPIYSDHVSNNIKGIAAFSSRGPCLDGRYKPDIVAPGTNILSTRSSVASGTGWGVYNDYYLWDGGTSMSCPLVAGASALMREYLTGVKGHTAPSAALIKAALLNSAEDISPGQYGTGSAREIPSSPVPNYVEGWGRLNLGNGVYPSSPFNILYYDVQSSLSTGEDIEYAVNVSSSNYPLRVNLAWTDYPGSPTAQGGLVNDLDLQVTDPSATRRYPDHASQKPAVNTLIYDNSNPFGYLRINQAAVRFTPSSYPVNVESTTFWFDNSYSSTTDVDIVVYDDNGTGSLPGTELFRKTLTYVPDGFVTIGITGVSISSGDFYIAIEKENTSMGVNADLTDLSGRSYYFNGSEWALSYFATYIRANVRGTDHSTSFDRVNNVVGLTLTNPATGTYKIKVSGYNVPKGPQPYALVVSGAVARALPAAPALTVTTSGTTVSVSWTSVADATGYTLYYAPFPYTGPDSIKNIPMGTQTSMSARLWKGATFYVAIRSYNNTGTSAFSNIEHFVID